MSDTSVIALAIDWPVYAPLYIAQEAHYFGPTPVVFGKFRRKVPEQRLTVPPTGNNRDATFLHQQIATVWQAFRHNPPLITVCDPMHGLLHNAWPGKLHKVWLAGALLVKPACWFFNCTHDFNILLQRLRARTLSGIRTHPPGMSADTLARWALMRKGQFVASDLNKILLNVTEPGDELQVFAPGRNGGTSRAAASVDYITMRRLADSKASEVGICLDCCEVVDRYLMTGILVREPELQNSKQIECILGGIELALELLTSNFDAAFRLLQQHYAKRAFQETSEALLERDYLEPLPPVTIQERYVHEMLRDFVRAQYYPTSLALGAMSDYLSSTWQVYKEAQQDILSEQSWDQLDARILPVTDPLKRRRQAVYRQTLMLLGQERVSRLTPRDTSHIMRWIRSLEGEFKASRFQVVGSFLLASNRRQELKGYIQQMRRSAEDVAASKTPAAYAVCGPPGSGKDRFVTDFLEACVKDTILAPWISLNLFDYKHVDSAGLKQLVVAALRQRMQADPPVGPVVPIFVNEVDKHPLRDDVFGTFCPIVLVDRQSVEREGLSVGVARHVFWVFSGTLVGTPETIAGRIRAANGGRDFISRLGIEHIISLPSLADPLEQILRFLAVCCTDQDGRPRPDRPESIAAELLLWFATLTLNDSRDPNRIMDFARGSLARRNSRRLETPHVLSHDQIATLYSLYDAECAELHGKEITLTWDL